MQYKIIKTNEIILELEIEFKIKKKEYANVNRRPQYFKENK